MLGFCSAARDGVTSRSRVAMAQRNLRCIGVTCGNDMAWWTRGNAVLCRVKAP